MLTAYRGDHDDMADTLDYLISGNVAKVVIRQRFNAGAWRLVAAVCSSLGDMFPVYLLSILGFGIFQSPAPLNLLFMASGACVAHVILRGILSQRATSVSSSVPGATATWDGFTLKITHSLPCS